MTGKYENMADRRLMSLMQKSVRKILTAIEKWAKTGIGNPKKRN